MTGHQNHGPHPDPHRPDARAAPTPPATRPMPHHSAPPRVSLRARANRHPAEAPWPDLRALTPDVGAGRAGIAAVRRERNRPRLARAALGREPAVPGRRADPPRPPHRQWPGEHEAGLRGATAAIPPHLGTPRARSRSKPSSGWSPRHDWHSRCTWPVTASRARRTWCATLPLRCGRPHGPRRPAARAGAPAVTRCAAAGHGDVWVKLSGADRLATAPPAIPTRPRAALMLPQRPGNGCVWGTDFPHPNTHGFNPDDGDLVNRWSRSRRPRTTPAPDWGQTDDLFGLPGPGWSLRRAACSFPVRAGRGTLTSSTVGTTPTTVRPLRVTGVYAGHRFRAADGAVTGWRAVYPLRLAGAGEPRVTRPYGGAARRAEGGRADGHLGPAVTPLDDGLETASATASTTPRRRLGDGEPAPAAVPSADRRATQHRTGRNARRWYGEEHVPMCAVARAGCVIIRTAGGGADDRLPLHELAVAGSVRHACVPAGGAPRPGARGGPDGHARAAAVQPTTGPAASDAARDDPEGRRGLRPRRQLTAAEQVQGAARGSVWRRRSRRRVEPDGVHDGVAPHPQPRAHHVPVPISVVPSTVVGDQLAARRGTSPPG